MSSCVDAISAAPTESENTKANVCDDPLPEEGVTDTAAGGCGVPPPPLPPPLVVVNVPFTDQPLSSVAFWASMKMFFAPAKAGLKLSARFSVSVLPLGVTEDAPA